MEHTKMEQIKLTEAEAAYCDMLLQSEDEQLPALKKHLEEETSKKVKNDKELLMFTTSENYSMFVRIDFAYNAVLNEINYRKVIKNV